MIKILKVLRNVDTSLCTIVNVYIQNAVMLSQCGHSSLHIHISMVFVSSMRRLWRHCFPTDDDIPWWCGTVYMAKYQECSPETTTKSCAFEPTNASGFENKRHQCACFYDAKVRAWDWFHSAVWCDVMDEQMEQKHRHSPSTIGCACFKL